MPKQGKRGGRATAETSGIPQESNEQTPPTAVPTGQTPDVEGGTEITEETPLVEAKDRCMNILNFVKCLCWCVRPDKVLSLAVAMAQPLVGFIAVVASLVWATPVGIFSISQAVADTIVSVLGLLNAFVLVCTDIETKDTRHTFQNYSRAAMVGIGLVSVAMFVTEEIVNTATVAEKLLLGVRATMTLVTALVSCISDKFRYLEKGVQQHVSTRPENARFIRVLGSQSSRTLEEGQLVFYEANPGKDGQTYLSVVPIDGIQYEGEWAHGGKRFMYGKGNWKWTDKTRAQIIALCNNNTSNV